MKEIIILIGKNIQDQSQEEKNIQIIQKENILLNIHLHIHHHHIHHHHIHHLILKETHLQNLLILIQKVLLILQVQKKKKIIINIK